jgi:hypothetical protein
MLESEWIDYIDVGASNVGPVIGAGVSQTMVRLPAVKEGGIT